VYLGEAILPLLPGPAGRGVIALVGAGGKTSALFGLGEELALGAPGAAVLLTTTTHIYDPRLEPGRGFDRLALEPALEAPAQGGAGPCPLPGGPGRLVLAAREEPGTGKLKGIHPSRVSGLARAWDWVVVEADGAKQRPVKAPAGHEPALPPVAGLVLGFVGLGCLGRPMDAAAVHRPERFGPVTGCAPGAPIGLEHLAALAASPQGLFKDAPSGARRVLALNQADLCGLAPGELLAAFRALAGPGVDLVLVCSLQDPRPEARVLARWPAQ
jgi:probable selenium-dependent hydroxylase accessory protein YqeC